MGRSTKLRNSECEGLWEGRGLSRPGIAYRAQRLLVNVNAAPAKTNPDGRDRAPPTSFRRDGFVWNCFTFEAIAPASLCDMRAPVSTERAAPVPLPSGDLVTKSR